MTELQLSPARESVIVGIAQALRYRYEARVTALQASAAKVGIAIGPGPEPDFAAEAALLLDEQIVRVAGKAIVTRLYREMEGEA